MCPCACMCARACHACTNINIYIYIYAYFQPGWYIQVCIAHVNRQTFKAFAMVENKPLIVVALLPYEHKMSLLNVVLKSTSIYTQPIKSKERLIFQCGFRRFTACPIFSQHTNGAKHKVSRFILHSKPTLRYLVYIFILHCDKYVWFSTRDTFTLTVLSWRVCMHRLLFHHVQSFLTSRIKMASLYVFC